MSWYSNVASRSICMHHDHEDSLSHTPKDKRERHEVKVFTFRQHRAQVKLAWCQSWNRTLNSHDTTRHSTRKSRAPGSAALTWKRSRPGTIAFFLVKKRLFYTGLTTPGVTINPTFITRLTDLVASTHSMHARAQPTSWHWYYTSISCKRIRMDCTHIICLS